MIDIVKQTPAGNRWSPTGLDIVKSFTKWLSRHPAPKWVVPA